MNGWDYSIYDYYEGLRNVGYRWGGVIGCVLLSAHGERGVRVGIACFPIVWGWGSEGEVHVWYRVAF